jgi:orotidine-5'-phosphate decarboxylase
VAGGIRAVVELEPTFITIHTAGGAAMMKVAAETAAAEAKRLGVARPRLLGVTVLTSLDKSDLEATGIPAEPDRQVLRLATLARSSGLDGVICSPLEIAALRKECGKDFTLMVPGIRPAGAATADQKRVMTPKEAVTLGANHLVIGRPITEAADPALAAEAIARALGAL